ncbi:MAG TPA: 30S ribosomal protein S17 [Candidatus Megaira endosymbiont of Hartmannula sinica]|nr:30S ribosomal protein S17 [Candidatus Megaera endosymbiont of Hartmannula sinica]
MPKKVIKGKVVSNKLKNTLSVLVERKKKHSIYGKSFTVSKKYLVHYEKGSFNVNDSVEIVESKPFSKKKRFEIKSS